MFQQKDKYSVRLELFEGPLDLLLYLIKKNEVDIYDIPIETITQQYLEYLALIKEMNLDNVGEFILLASHLIYIKSQMLLPEEERNLEDDMEDPRWELVQQLLEYRKFKNAAGKLDVLQKEEAKRYPRFAEILFEEEGASAEKKIDVSVFELLEAFSQILKSKSFDNSLNIEQETVTVAEKITELRERLKTEISLFFHDIFRGARTKLEMICSFLAVLELVKSGEIITCQNENFGQITLQKNTAYYG